MLMYNTITNRFSLFNKNENPIEILESIKKTFYQTTRFKKFLENYNCITELNFKSIYQSGKFSELTDNIRLKQFQFLFFNKIIGSLKKSSMVNHLNCLIFPRSCFYFLTESVLLTSKVDVNSFSFLFNIIDFLTINNYIKTAFLILEKLFQKKKTSEIEKIFKNFKKFDILYLSKNYTKAKIILNKLQSFNIKENSTPEIAAEITFRLANFSMKENNFSSAVSYFIESLFKSENFNKLKFSFLAELLLFCSNFVKNFRLISLSNKLSILPNNFNFLFLKFLWIAIKKDNLAAIDFTCAKIKQNIINKNIKKILKKIHYKLLVKKILKISNSYLRLPVKSFLIILGIHKKTLKKKIELLVLTRKILCFLDKKSESFIFFEKKNQTEFFSILMNILIQLNSAITLKLDNLNNTSNKF
nr:hypothetical protein CcurKRNrm2_p077 [Cryptomonas curvata]